MTDKHTDIRTFRLIERIGQEGRFFQNHKTGALTDFFLNSLWKLLTLQKQIRAFVVKSCNLSLRTFGGWGDYGELGI